MIMGHIISKEEKKKEDILQLLYDTWQVKFPSHPNYTKNNNDNPKPNLSLPKRTFNPIRSLQVFIQLNIQYSCHHFGQRSVLEV